MELNKLPQFVKSIKALPITMIGLWDYNEVLNMDTLTGVL